MTRINAGVNPEELHRLHLIAEYREITMVPAALKRSLRTQTIETVRCKIPKEFTLNAGHVTYFYDKLAYLKKRMRRIMLEMQNRGYKIDESRMESFVGIPECFYGDWTETPKSRSIVLERINIRKGEKPWLYG